MFNMLPLHAIASPRGDGLHPLILELLAARNATYARGAGIEDIAQRRGDPHVQAGPHPIPDMQAPLPGGVIRFEPRNNNATAPGRAVATK